MSTSLNSDTTSPEKTQVGSVSGGGQTPTVGTGSGSEEGGEKSSTISLSTAAVASVISPGSSQFQRLKVHAICNYLLSNNATCTV